MNIEDIIRDTYTRNELIELLELSDKDDLDALYQAAYQVKTENVGNIVYYRGILEWSNVCAKDCFYCGIRKGNPYVSRYTMTDEEVMEGALWAEKQDYGSIVIQSGERRDRTFVEKIESLVRMIKDKTDLGITLSLGEQSEDTYRRWFEAGAHRYLLRIETSNPLLYGSLHPEDHDHSERFRCLDRLRDTGWQVGTGVMIGLPGQTTEDLADDILFFKKEDIDMIGMGPFIPHNQTPLADSLGDFSKIKEKQLRLALKMVAVTRLFLKDVNIAATTALQALNPVGREMGLLAGANIMMPNITPTHYREGYQLYEDKPCLDENSAKCRDCLEDRISFIGEKIGYGLYGDSNHFLKKHPEKRADYSWAGDKKA